MKLPAEEIRKRVKETVDAIWSGYDRRDATSAIIKLIEEDRGERLPEPFDESKVQHLSMWRIPDYASDYVILREACGDDMTAIISNTPEGFEVSVTDIPKGTRYGMIARLREKNAQYLGQYNWQAGLPGKEAA